MPEPRSGETKDAFISRCMGDSESMKDFPETDQRFAFCNSKWEQVKKEADEIEKTHTGVMTGFFLPREVSEQIALKNGEAVEDLHLTVAFHGDKTELPEGSQEKMKNALLEFAKTAPVIKGKINGLGRFNPSENSGDKSVLFAIFDAPELPQFRQDLINKLQEAGIPTKKDHGFVPHITLAYFDKDFDLPNQNLNSHEMTFDKLTIAFGDQREEIQLSKTKSASTKALDIDEKQKEGVNKQMPQHISDEAKNALKGALKILRDFSDELPASVFNLLNQTLSGSSHDDSVDQNKNIHPDKRKKRKMNKEIIVEFIAKQEEQRLVTGIVLEPNTIDAHGDLVKEETIEKAAFDFMIKSRTIGKQHKNVIEDVKVVESFIAPLNYELNGQPIKKGSWIMTVKVMNDQIWQDVKKGSFTGFSIGGFGEKVPVEETV